MFYDETSVSGQLCMKNVQIDIINGIVYGRSHLIENYINITDVLIQTNQLNTDDTTAIFNFEAVDIVNITNITILYIYDASLHCKYGDIISNSIINVKCDCYSCKNQMIL